MSRQLLVTFLKTLLLLFAFVGTAAQAVTFNLSLASGTNVSGGGTCAVTAGSKCRFSNVVQGNPPSSLQRDLIVTIVRFQGGASIATTTGVNPFDNDALQLTPVGATTASGPVRTDMFAPTVRAPANATAVSWVEYLFEFVTPGTTTLSPLPGTFFVTSFDTDGAGAAGTNGTTNGLREFIEFTSPTPAQSGLAATTNVQAGAAVVAGGTNYIAKFVDNQAGVGSGDPYKVSARYTDAGSFSLAIGARQSTTACSGVSCDKLSALSFQISESVVTSPVVDGYKSVRHTVDADGSGTVTPGDTLTWTVTYVNTGNANVTGFQIIDTLPGNVTFTAGGQTVTAGAGSTATKNTAYNGTSATGLLAPNAILGLGSTVTVTIPVVVGLGAEDTTLGNQASASGTGVGVTLSDNVDNTTVFPPSVTASAGWTAPPAGSRLQNQTVALSPTTVAVGTGARLNVTKVADQALIRYSPAPAPTTLRYTITVTNTSAVTATAVQVTDTLPASLTYAASESGNTPPTTRSGQTLTWDLGSLAPNASRSVTVFVNVPTASSLEAAAGTGQTAIVNTASVQAGNAPANSGSVPVNTLYTRLFKQVRNLGHQGTLTPAWAGSVNGKPGDVLEYCIDFANLGSTTLANYRVSDVVPANTQLVPGSASVRQGRMDAPGAAYPGMTVGVSETTNTAGQPTQLLQTSALTFAPGSQGTLCFRAAIR